MSVLCLFQGQHSHERVALSWQWSKIGDALISGDLCVPLCSIFTADTERRSKTLTAGDMKTCFMSSFIKADMKLNESKSGNVRNDCFD